MSEPAGIAATVPATALDNTAGIFFECNGNVVNGTLAESKPTGTPPRPTSFPSGPRSDTDPSAVGSAVRPCNVTVNGSDSCRVGRCRTMKLTS